MSQLKNKTKLKIRNKPHIFYFTASWCGGCKYFYPILRKFIRENKNIEVIVVSFDTKEESFKNFIKKERVRQYVKFRSGKVAGIYELCGDMIPWITYLNKKDVIIFSEVASEKLLNKIKELK